MAQKQLFSSFFMSIVVIIVPIFLFSSFSHAQTLTSPEIESLCDSTPYPLICKSILIDAKPGPVSGYAEIVFKKVLEASKGLLDLVATSSLSQAIEDCRFLVGQSNDYLDHVEESTVNFLNDPDPDYIVTLLSAVMTNYDTCKDSIGEVFVGKPPPPESFESEILDRTSNNFKMVSICLGLYKQAQPFPLPETKPPPRLLSEKKWSEISVRKMSERERMIYERVMVVGRKLLQSPYPNNDTPVNVTKTVVVNPNDPTAFRTIKDAVDSAPIKANGSYYVIYVVAGVYEEYVNIPSNKTYLMIVGDGIDKTIITGNRSVGDNSTTYASATLAINGKGFLAANITVRNTAGAAKHQAVAVRSSADMSAFYKCSFEAYQDTLYAHSFRQFYRECDIYGTVDFIFGNAAVVFQNCNIFPRLPLQGQFNALTAQGRTDLNQNTGISIQNCTIKPSVELLNGNFSVKTYLGRPWKEYSRTVYLQNFMDGFIDPKGWREWMGDFALYTLYYAEFNNTGPGSDIMNRVTWSGYRVINETEAGWFTVDKFVAGDSWLPFTGVPFVDGLIS